MVFILGTNMAESRLVKRTLETFFGIGRLGSQRIMARLYIYPTAKLGDLSTKQALDVNAELSSMTIENELRRKITEKIRLLRDMGSYRGRRHAQRLPVRGQNTQSQKKTAFKLNKIERWHL